MATNRSERLAALGIRGAVSDGLTHAILERVQLVPLEERYILTDGGPRGVVGLFLRVGAGRLNQQGKRVAGPASFYVQGRPVRGAHVVQVHLGSLEIGLEHARKRAREELVRMARGVNPNTEAQAKREAKRKSVSFSDFIEDTYWERIKDLRSGAERLRHLRVLMETRAGKGTLGDISLNEVTEQHINEVLLARKPDVSAGTLVQDWQALGMVLRWAYKARHLKEVPFRQRPGALEGVRPNTRKRWLGERGPEEVTRFWKAVGKEEDAIQSILKLLVLTGMRISELLGLEESEVSWSEKFATIPAWRAKSKVERIVRLNDEAVALLKGVQVRDTAGAFFPGARESRGWYLRLQKAWARILKRSRIEDLVIHDLRHTHAALLRKGGARLDTVRDQLGHADIKMTQRYAHLGHDEIAEAVARVRL